MAKEVTTEERIAKVIKRDGILFKGEAEGLEWVIVPKPFSAVEIEVGDFVPCYVLVDEGKDDYYLQQIQHAPLASYKDWLLQEKEFPAP